MPSLPCPIPSDDESDTSSGLPETFPDSASDSDSSTVPSVFDDSSESESDSDSESDDELEDELVLEDEEEQLSPEYYLQEAEALDVSQLRQKRYSPKTQERLDKMQYFWDRFCEGAKRDLVKCLSWISDTEETVRFLKALFSWRCDQRRGKDGRRTPGLKTKSSLDAFWKWWYLIYKAAVGHGLSKDIQVKIRDVLAVVAMEKKLSLKKRPKATMFVEDVAEFARVILSTIEMTFPCGWYRIQLLLFCQLAAITGNRLGALLKLRFRDLKLILIRDPNGGRPRLFIYLRPEFTKGFLGEKQSEAFPIPEIIFDLTLVLSPHVFLLGILFRIGAFKSLSNDSPVLDCPEKLYRLRVLNGLGEQELKLKDEIMDQYVFCQALREADGFRFVPEIPLTRGWLGYRMKRGGEITGFAEVAKLYCLRYGAAKAFNDSPDVSNELQNVMLQHVSIDTFVRYYSVGIYVDAQAIVRGLPADKQLMRFACSMSRSIDPRRPYRLGDLSCINDLPCVRALEDTKQARKRIRDVKMCAYEDAEAAFQREFGGDPESATLSRTVRKRRKAQEKSLKKFRQKFEYVDEQYDRVVKHLRNEKRRQKHRLIRENLERYKNEQLVIDSEQQMSGKIIDEEVIGALQRTGYITPQHMMLIDSILTLPGITVTKEYERRIAVINAVIVVCDAEEGAPWRPSAPQKRSVDAIDTPNPSSLPKRQKSTSSDESDDRFSQAIASVCVKSREERPTICFICLGNPHQRESERLKMYKNPGSLSRHFVNKHIKRFSSDMHCECNICGKSLMSKSELLNHAHGVHGIVSRLPLPALGLPLPQMFGVL